MGKTVVVDNGSGLCKAGFSGDDAPRAFVLPVVCRPRLQDPRGEISQKDCIIGEDALNNTNSSLSRRWPLDDGYISDWDDMEKIWHHVFYRELSIAPEDHPVLITEGSFDLVRKLPRERVTQIMFEKFGIPSLYAANQSVLALYSCGLMTGMVVQIGHHNSDIVPIYGGHVLTYTLKRPYQQAGSFLTWSLRDMLKKKGHNLDLRSFADRKNVEMIKEQLCYVSLNMMKEKENASSTLSESYVLPDGQKITLDEERYLCPEVLFEPSILDEPGVGVHKRVYSSLMLCDSDLHEVLLSNIVLAGGSTLFRGFPERLHKEITQLLPESSAVRCITPPDRKYPAWIGGSMMSSLSTFQQMCITKEDYDEYGPYVVHHKCFS